MSTLGVDFVGSAHARYLFVRVSLVEGYESVDWQAEVYAFGGDVSADEDVIGALSEIEQG
jgi:hypothetical protein